MRNVSRPKKSSAPSAGASAERLTTSSVLTRKSSPAPSQSLAVMMGVFTQTKPCSSKYRWIAWAIVLRTRAIAPNVFVRGRRCATVRRYSNVWRFLAIG